MSSLDEFVRAFSRLGNDIGMVIGAARNLGMDYEDTAAKLQKLAEELKALSRLESRGLAEAAGFRDRVILRHLDREGNLVDERDTGWHSNTLTNAGFAEVAGLITADVGGTAFDYIAIGTGTTPPSATDTALQSETHRIGGASVTGTRVTTSVANDTMQLVGTFSGYTGTEAVTESGVLNASSGGVLLCRQTFSALNINWGAGDSLQVTWRVQVKAG